MSILNGIANPMVADIGANFREGEARGQAKLTKQMAGEILSKTFGGKLGALGNHDPEVAMKLAQGLGIPADDKARLQSFAGDIQAATAIANGAGPQEAVDYLKEVRDRRVQIIGGDSTPRLDSMIQYMEANPQEGVEALNLQTNALIEQGFLKSENSGTKYSAKTEILEDGTTIQMTNSGKRIIKDPSGRVVTGQAAADVIKKANQEGIRLQSERAGGRTAASEEEKAASTLINRGVAAAESTATVRRAIELLDTVSTGGWDGVSLAVRQKLGVSGADEAELTASLGKSVLSQLRETFGSAFTENEGKRLERIEANIGNSAAGNKRLLNQALRIAERTAKRAKVAAQKRGQEDVVKDIDDLLEFSLSIDNSKPKNGAPKAGYVKMVDANGNQAWVGPNGEVEPIE